ncbi:MAG: hypothetical protein WC974_02030 [Thermoplasmata archaeon]
MLIVYIGYFRFNNQTPIRITRGIATYMGTTHKKSYDVVGIVYNKPIVETVNNNTGGILYKKAFLIFFDDNEIAQKAVDNPDIKQTNPKLVPITYPIAFER